MKNIWILVLVIAIAIGFTARATPLEDKVKSFSDALKANPAGKDNDNPMMDERMAAVGQGLEASLQTPGGEANIRAMVTQIMAMNPAEAVQAAGKALLAELDAEQKARADAFTAQLNEVLSRAPEILGAAQKPEELDGLLADLQKVQVPPGGGYGYDSESQGAVNRVNSAYQFIAQWQDYLSARNSGNTQEAQNTLRNLASIRQPGDAMLVPRSEILARTVQLASMQKTSVPAVPGMPPPPGDNAPILDGIKTLDDLEPALKSLRGTPSQNYDLPTLSQMAALYADARNGLPVTFDFNLPNYGNSMPEWERIKAMLLIYLLPRYIGSGALTPNANETVNDYLKRSIDAAAASQDWVSLQRAISAEIKISKNQPSSGTMNFLAGLNQEMAGQYALAVTSYETALNNPDDFLPAKVIGDRLTLIQKDHPTEFEAGMKSYLNPPQRAFVNPYMNPYMRPGMPGYPYPVSMPVPAPGIAAPAPPAKATLPTAVTNAPPVAPAPAAK